MGWDLHQVLSEDEDGNVVQQWVASYESLGKLFVIPF